MVVALPGTVLPGDFQIAARKTYGHISDGMICSQLELGLGEDHDGIIVLPSDAGEPGDDAVALLWTADEVLDIDVTPDLSYCLSLRGLAREASIVNGVSFEDPYRQHLPEPTDGGPASCWRTPRCTAFVALTLTASTPAPPPRGGWRTG